MKKDISKRELLIDKNWFTVNYICDYDGDGIYEWDEMEDAEFCETDDSFIFKDDETIWYDQGNIMCDNSLPNFTQVGTWTMSNDESYITLYISSLERDWILENISEKEFSISYTFDSFGQIATCKVSFESR